MNRQCLMKTTCLALVVGGMIAGVCYACVVDLDIVIYKWNRYVAVGEEADVYAEVESGGPVIYWGWDWDADPSGDGGYSGKATSDYDSTGYGYYSTPGIYEAWVYAENNQSGTDVDYAYVYAIEADIDIAGVAEEAEENTGGFIALNDDDDDGDGVIDYDDGYNKDGIPGNADDQNPSENDLVAISLRVSPSLSNGTVKLEAVSGGTKIKIWTNSTKGTQVTLPKTWNLSSESVPSTRYVEGMSASSSVRDVELRLSYISPSGSSVEPSNTTIHQDSVKLTVVEVDLDISGVSDADEEATGGLVVRRCDNNNAPRKEIILRKVVPNDWGGNVVLSRAPANIKVYDDQTAGTEITFDGVHNKFANSVLPKSLWVQGDTATNSMRGVEIDLVTDSVPACVDVVTFTVLWVEVVGSYSGTLSSDNDKRDYWKNNHAVPPDYSLGHHLAIARDVMVWWGYLAEFKGIVAPSNFDPAEFGGDLHLAREKTDLGHYYYGPNGRENSYTTSIGDDTTSPEFRDDDPSPNGKIYDIDAPGLNLVRSTPAGTIWRKRYNFREWATWGSVRCSEYRTWYHAFSMKLTGAEDVGTATGGSANTLQDSTKDWASNTWKFIHIGSGTGAGQIRLITSNTASTIMIGENWTTIPDTTTQYYLLTDTTWTIINDVAGDNATGDGQLSHLTWDLQ